MKICAGNSGRSTQTKSCTIIFRNLLDLMGQNSIGSPAITMQHRSCLHFLLFQLLLHVIITSYSRNIGILIAKFPQIISRIFLLPFHLFGLLFLLLIPRLLSHRLTFAIKLDLHCFGEISTSQVL